MSYSFQSRNFNIPAPQLGDTLNETDERRAAEIIDTQLAGLAKSFSGGHGILSEGTYSSVLNFDLTATVTLTEFTGFINQVYASATTIIWADIPIGTYDLYVIATEAGTASTAQFGNVVASIQPPFLSSFDGVLLARVVNTGVDVSVSTNLSEKNYIRTVASHEAINLNPHGDTWFQDTLVVSGLTASGLVLVQNLVISGSLTVNHPIIVSGTYSFDGLQVTVLSGVNADIDNLVVRNNLRVLDDLIVDDSLGISGTTIFYNNVTLTPGSTINGVSTESLTNLIDGNNADTLHTHSIVSPVGSVVSGANFVSTGRVFFGNEDFNIKYYDLVDQHVFDEVVRSVDADNIFYVVDRIGVPSDFEDLHPTFCQIYIRSNNTSGNGIVAGVEAFDTAGNPIGLSGNDISPTSIDTWQRFDVITSGSGFTFSPGEFYTIRYVVTLSTSGTTLDLGEATYPYMRLI